MSQASLNDPLVDLRKAFEANDVEWFVGVGEKFHYADLAEFYENLLEDERERFAHLLGGKQFASVLAELPDTMVEESIEYFSPEEQPELLDELMDDDLADALQDVSEDAKARYLSLLDPEDKKVVDALMKYGEDTAGGRMTTHYGRVQMDMTVKQAIDNLREIEEETQSLGRIFVVDSEGAVSYTHLTLPTIA